MRPAFGVGDDDRLAGFHHRDRTICRTEIYANDLRHDLTSLLDLFCLEIEPRFSTGYPS